MRECNAQVSCRYSEEKLADDIAGSSIYYIDTLHVGVGLLHAWSTTMNDSAERETCRPSANFGDVCTTMSPRVARGMNGKQVKTWHIPARPS
jgi:hypothetical protein